MVNIPDSKFHGANMGPIWGRQDPGGPHVGPKNWDDIPQLITNHGLLEGRYIGYWNGPSLKLLDLFEFAIVYTHLFATCISA